MFSAFILACFSMSGCTKDTSLKPVNITTDTMVCRVESNKLIYDAQKHCAFTDLIKFKDEFYLTFRASDSHVYGKDGHIIVLKSADGDNWQPEIDYEEKGLDLRDPKFNVTDDGRLVFYTQGVVFNAQKVLTVQRGLLVDATKPQFEARKPLDVQFPGSQAFWPWRFTKYNKAFYAVAYNQTPAIFKLIKTADFKKIDDLCDLSGIQMSPSETTIRFNRNKCYLLMRRNGPALLGISNADDICNIQWKELPLFGLGGPNFLFYDDNTLLICGRDYVKPGDYTYADNRTSLFVYKIKENKTVRILTLPTWGDTSYPGLYLNKNDLWISYYSTSNGSTKVYLAKTKLSLSNL